MDQACAIAGLARANTARGSERQREAAGGSERAGRAYVARLDGGFRLQGAAPQLRLRLEALRARVVGMRSHARGLRARSGVNLYPAPYVEDTRSTVYPAPYVEDTRSTATRRGRTVYTGTMLGNAAEELRRLRPRSRIHPGPHGCLSSMPQTIWNPRRKHDSVRICAKMPVRSPGGRTESRGTGTLGAKEDTVAKRSCALRPMLDSASSLPAAATHGKLSRGQWWEGGHMHRPWWGIQARTAARR